MENHTDRRGRPGKIERPEQIPPMIGEILKRTC